MAFKISSSSSSSRQGNSPDSFISLTPLALSTINPGKSFRWYSVSAQNWWMQYFAGLPTKYCQPSPPMPMEYATSASLEWHVWLSRRSIYNIYNEQNLPLKNWYLKSCLFTLVWTLTTSSRVPHEDEWIMNYQWVQSLLGYTYFLPCAKLSKWL